MKREKTGEIITACNLDCPDSCSIRVSRDREGGLLIRGNPDHPFTRGFTCRKIRDYPRRLSHPDRIRTPLLRRDGVFSPLSWEAALDLCAEKIQSLRREPAAILHLHGEGAKGVLKAGPSLFFGLLGASTTRGCLCDGTGIAAVIADFGALDMNDLDDLRNAQGIVNWGKDLSRTSIHTAALIREARKRGTPVLTVSPGGDGNGPFSDEFIRIRPGADRFLAAAVLRLFLDRGGFDPALLERSSNGTLLEKRLRDLPVEHLVSACDVPLGDVERLFSFYRDRRPAATLIGWGLQRYRFGGENVRWINGLAFLSGNLGIRGGGSYFNVSSRRNFNLGWALSFDSRRIRKLFLPAIGKEIREAANPPIKMIWVNGFNVVNQAPDSGAIADAFDKVDFTVVVDAFMTDTAIRADLVLPCTLNFEQEDIIGSYLHNYIQYARPAVPPPEGCRDDFAIMAELGKRLDPPVILPPREACLRLSLQSPFLDVSLEELRTRGYAKASREPVAFRGGAFGHPDGKCRLPETLHEEPPPPPAYPLILLSLIRGDAIHSQIPPEDQGGLPVACVGPGCPADLGTDMDGTVACLVSPLGRMTVRLRVLDDLHPRVVLYRRGDWMRFGGGVNRIISAAFTDMGNGTAYYSQCVRLEKR